MGPTRKRVLIGFSVLAIIALMVKFILHNGTILEEHQVYQHTPGVPLIITVFYETLCIDSKVFILKQLVPAYKKLTNYINIEFVPYGKATTTTDTAGSLHFECQHGPTECEGNIYHACAIEAIHDAETRLNMIACMMRDNRKPKQAMHKCAKEYNVENVDLIQKCHDSPHGNELLKLNGEATNAIRPPLSFIPTITLDGAVYNQAAILKNLIGEVCKIIADTDEAQKICSNQAHQH